MTLADLTLPDGVELVRTTDAWTAETAPGGLLREHRLAVGVWGRLCVSEGTVTFVDEASGERRVVAAGEHQVIPPDAPHHVEPGDGARFHVEMLR